LPAFVTFEFGGLFQPTIANLCRGFAAAFCQVLAANFENQLAGIFQHNGLDRIQKLSWPSPTRQGQESFVNCSQSNNCLRLLYLPTLCRPCRPLWVFFVVDLQVWTSAGLFFWPIFASLFYKHLPTFADLCQSFAAGFCSKQPLPTFLASLSYKPFAYFCRPLPIWETKVYILSMYTYDDVGRPFPTQQLSAHIEALSALSTFCQKILLSTFEQSLPTFFAGLLCRPFLGHFLFFASCCQP
jgi:hypothetical protein